MPKDQGWGDMWSELNDPGLADQERNGSGYVIDPDPVQFARQEASARLQLTSTSTTNPSRPRTLAAGYNAQTKTMTVVFRDNTWWNYYDVPEDIWEGFRQAQSKGQYLRESGLDSWGKMGRADLTGLSQTQRQALNFMAMRAAAVQKYSAGRQEEDGTIGRQFNP